MKTPAEFLAHSALVLLLTANIAAAESAPTSITPLRTPAGGLQPQTVTDPQGTLHLLYFSGDPKQGNLFYMRREANSTLFSTPIRVNHNKGDAVAIGTIRGGQLAVGRNGRVHVAWNGSEPVPASAHSGVPLWYTRSNDQKTAFEPERDLMGETGSLDGGCSIAADDTGRVFVTWHARPANTPEGEETRSVFIAQSGDDGKSFARERPVQSETQGGVCACCGMRSWADNAGGVYLLFRSAAAMTNRGEVLMVSRDAGKRFETAYLDPWNSATCPMSSAFLSPGPKGSVLAAWETGPQIFFTKLERGATRISPAVGPPGKTAKKHPVTVQNAKGEILVVWTEGTGWEKGGSVVWQLYDAQLQPLSQHGRTDGVPAWSLAAAYAEPDGDFVILY